VAGSRARVEPMRLGLSGGRSRPRRRRRRWPWALAAVVLLVLAALAFARFAWPHGSLTSDAGALARLRAPGRLAAGQVEVSARRADGGPLRVVVGSDGRLWPARPVAPGTRIRVEVVFRRPGWAGWIAGRSERHRLEVVAPAAHLVRRWLSVRLGEPVRVRFDRPVRKLVLAGAGPPRHLRLAHPVRSVALGALGSAGSVELRAASRSWESLPPPTSVTWFPPGDRPKVLVSPRPGSPLAPGTRLQLRFSAPLRDVLRGQRPRLEPAVAGRWLTLDSHTLQFTPVGYGFGLNRPVRLTLPTAVEQAGRAPHATRTITWTTPQATELRLQQLLAELNYLPVTWTAATSDSARTVPAELAAAIHPPAGSFEWRYPNIPPELSALWSPGRPNEIVRGALMLFQDTHGLTVDGFAGPNVWRALIGDVVAGKGHDGGYSYVFVHRGVPQSLNLWHDGEVILSSPGNTGVPAAPTQLGTFPVFEHILVGTMSGTNPDGSHYNDPGIRYISYFNHGDAIHAFNRASFGTPQSLGCVELPLDAAAKVWPYTPIGTLVTIEN
jgi:peptidoglycan hydrolase-like protein with peptidoglycan-binding domain